jgi:hypothetical protein
MIFNIFSPLRRRGRREKIFSLAVERPAREKFLGASGHRPEPGYLLINVL